MIGNKYIDVSLHKKILRIGINRPRKKNALTIKMYNTLRLTLLNARENPDVRVVLLHGTTDAFCAGNDLKEFDDRDPNTSSPAEKFLIVLQAFNKPIIAAVSGIAVGVGVTMLLHCDLVYATQNTQFQLSFINLGVCPEAGSSFLLPANAGLKKAAEVLMLGNFFDTTKATNLGIINRAVETKNVLDYALKKAEELTQKSQQALLIIKKLIKQGNQQDVIERMSLESKLFGELLLTPESIEARAKLKKRIQKSKNLDLS